MSPTRILLTVLLNLAMLAALVVGGYYVVTAGRCA